MIAFLEKNEQLDICRIRIFQFTAVSHMNKFLLCLILGQNLVSKPKNEAQETAEKSIDGDTDDKGSEHGDEADQSLERIHSDCSDTSSVDGNDHDNDNLEDNEEIDVVSDNNDAATRNPDTTSIITSQVAPTIIRQPFPIKPSMPSSVHSSLLPPGTFLSSPHLAGLSIKTKIQ